MTDVDGQIETAVAFLSKCRRTRRDGMSSTVLKTIIQRWSGRHVSNQSVIDAAEGLGFNIRHCRAPSNVAMIGLVKADVEKLRDETTRREIAAMRDAIG
jgi:hypothetical protein